jgi:signal transduction histidine kinase
VGTLLDVLAEQLIKDPKWEPMWKDKLSVMQGCVRAGKKMLSDLTVLTAQITPRPKLTNFRELLRRAALGVLPEQAKIDLQHLPPDTQLLVDPELMEQAFRELCTNAVRAAGENLSLIISEKKEKGTLNISFQDNGPGIPSERAECIFEPFVVFPVGRTGLGLATVRRIIEAHGGSIRLQESTVGAHFVISLPLEWIKQK